MRRSLLKLAAALSAGLWAPQAAQAEEETPLLVPHRAVYERSAIHGGLLTEIRVIQEKFSLVCGEWRSESLQGSAARMALDPPVFATRSSVREKGAPAEMRYEFERKVDFAKGVPGMEWSGAHKVGGEVEIKGVSVVLPEETLFEISLVRALMGAAREGIKKFGYVVFMPLPSSESPALLRGEAAFEPLEPTGAFAEEMGELLPGRRFWSVRRASQDIAARGSPLDLYAYGGQQIIYAEGGIVAWRRDALGDGSFGLYRLKSLELLEPEGCS